MKKPINEVAKLKRLAGLITESEYQEAVMQSEEKMEEATDLKIKGYYQVLDAGMDEWNDDFQYMGKVAGGSSAGEVGERMFAAPDAPGSFIFVTVPEADLDTMVKPSMSEGKEKEDNLSDDIVVKWTKKYLDNEKKDPYFYTEKGLADGFKVINGQKVKEIVGYDEDDNDEVIGHIYSKSKKDIETEYSEDDLDNTFTSALNSMSEGKEKEEEQFAGINEDLSSNHIQLIQNIIDNYNDGGIDADPAMDRIERILNGDLSMEDPEELNENALRNSFLSPEAYDRMSGLSNTRAQQAMIKAAEIMMNDLTAEGFEVPEIREFFHILISNDI